MVSCFSCASLMLRSVLSLQCEGRTVLKRQRVQPGGSRARRRRTHISWLISFKRLPTVVRASLVS